jgi:hypothetical protein
MELHWLVDLVARRRDYPGGATSALGDDGRLK